MRKALSLCLGVMLFALSASAQYGRDNPRRGPGGMALVDRTLRDLNYANRGSRGHQGTFEQARKDLLIFREHLNEGRFDRDRLDGAIENISRLANSDQVQRRDRRTLERDANDLRDLRARHGDRYR